MTLYGVGGIRSGRLVGDAKHYNTKFYGTIAVPDDVDLETAYEQITKALTFIGYDPHSLSMERFA